MDRGLTYIIIFYIIILCFLLFQAKPEIKGNTYSQIVLLFYFIFRF